MVDSKEEERSDMENLRAATSPIENSTTEDDEPPVKRARVREGEDEEVNDESEKKEDEDEKKEDEDERKAEEPQWIKGLTDVNKALLRAFIDVETDDIRAVVEDKEYCKPAISLLFELLMVVFKCNSRFEASGNSGEYRCSISLGASLVSSDPHKTKKEAKMECARRAIRALLTASPESVYSPTVTVVKVEEEGTVDPGVPSSPSEGNGPPAKRVRVEEGEEVGEEPEWAKTLPALNKALLRSFLANETDDIRAVVEGKEYCKNAISLAFELLAGVFKCNARFIDSGSTGEFRCSVSLGDSLVSSDAHKSKKEAKAECARRAIRALLKMNPAIIRTIKVEDTVATGGDTVSTNGEEKGESEKKRKMNGCSGYSCEGNVNRPLSDGVMAQSTLSNLIQEQAYALFYKLAETCPEAANTHRVLAAMFLQDKAKDKLHCVSLATGNKCIKASALSFEGKAVHDCHAEILTRRGLMRWLYAQVQLAHTAPEKSALVRGEGEDEGAKLRLRERFALHLFISTAPCGDGRVYQFGGKKGQKDFRNVGRLRHKIEDGEGTILGEKDDERLSIDSFMMGQRLRTMSCSDKVLKWNVMGLQGSLLSHFIHPIYLSSLSLAHFTRESCVARACYGRVKGFSPSDPEYKVNSSISLLSSSFVLPKSMDRGRPKSCSVSANWNATDEGVELIDTKTGRALQAKDAGLGAATSRLAKISMLSRFARLTPGSGSIKYRDAKRSSTAYNNTLHELHRYLEKEAQLGIWQSKPNDFSQLEVDE